MTAIYGCVQFCQVDSTFSCGVTGVRQAAINHSFADPVPYVAAAHGAGVMVFAQVQTVAQAQGAARAGVDVIIASNDPSITRSA
jgi:NAD(P)H-dependent flavin oxidoreductase YrpB (nitropropane dioxygenase family)